MSQMNDKKKIIEVKNLRAGYGFVEVVHDVSFSVGEGEILAILGSNGAGKTSTLRALTGEIKPMGEHAQNCFLCGPDGEIVELCEGSLN